MTMTTNNQINTPEPFAINKGGTGVTSVTTAPTASAWAGWDANKNFSAVGLIPGYSTTVTSASPVTLTVGSNQSQYFTGSTAQTLVMPVANTLVLGQFWNVVNNSSAVLTIQSSGGNTIIALPANSETSVTCILTSGTSASSWTTSPAVSGSGTVNSGLINQVAWYAASGTAVSGLATLASGVLVTSAGSVPSISTTLPASLTIPSPLITTAIFDTNGNRIIGLSATASSVNFLVIGNNATGANPVIQTQGTDGSISMDFQSKDGNFRFFDSSNTIAPTLELFNAAGSQYTGLKAATSQATTVVFTLPAADGSANSLMQTNGSGVLSLASQINASVLPAGTMFNFQQTQLTTPINTASGSFADASGLSVAITPTSSSNKVLVRAVIQFGVNPGITAAMFQLVRGSTAIGVGTTVGSRTAAGASGDTAGTSVMASIVMEWLDSPATTSATTYKVQYLSTVGGQSVFINSSSLDTNSASLPRTASTISVCEVHA
jgi:hypothetical protein